MQSYITLTLTLALVGSRFIVHERAVYVRLADENHRYAHECRGKARSNSSYEHVHDQHLAEGFFNDAVAREWSQNPKETVAALRAFRAELPRSSTAFDSDRFQQYLGRFLDAFIAKEGE